MDFYNTPPVYPSATSARRVRSYAAFTPKTESEPPANFSYWAKADWQKHIWSKIQIARPHRDEAIRKGRLTVVNVGDDREISNPGDRDLLHSSASAPLSYRVQALRH